MWQIKKPWTLNLEQNRINDCPRQVSSNYSTIRANRTAEMIVPDRFPQTTAPLELTEPQKWLSQTGFPKLQHH